MRVLEDFSSAAALGSIDADANEQTARLRSYPHTLRQE